MPALVLVVDDEPNVLAGFARALKLGGYRVRAVSDAKAALALVDEFPFDVAILDFLMPSMGGIELLAHIRKKLPTIRSIFISAQISKKLTAEELTAKLKTEVEADVYLHKPISNEELISTVSKLLSGTGETWEEFASRSMDGKAKKIKAAKATTKDLKKNFKEKA
jgi:two-component system OmpR family response regulator